MEGCGRNRIGEHLHCFCGGAQRDTAFQNDETKRGNSDVFGSRGAAKPYKLLGFVHICGKPSLFGMQGREKMLFGTVVREILVVLQPANAVLAVFFEFVATFVLSSAERRKTMDVSRLLRREEL